MPDLICCPSCRCIFCPRCRNCFFCGCCLCCYRGLCYHCRCYCFGWRATVHRFPTVPEGEEEGRGGVEVGAGAEVQVDLGLEDNRDGVEEVGVDNEIGLGIEENINEVEDGFEEGNVRFEVGERSEEGVGFGVGFEDGVGLVEVGLVEEGVDLVEASLAEEGVEIEVGVEVNGNVNENSRLEDNLRELEVLGWFGFSQVSDEIIKSLIEGSEVRFVWEGDEVRV